jgi:hypothetical protein
LLLFAVRKLHTNKIYNNSKDGDIGKMVREIQGTKTSARKVKLNRTEKASDQRRNTSHNTYTASKG